MGSGRLATVVVVAWCLAACATLPRVSETVKSSAPESGAVQALECVLVGSLFDSKQLAIIAKKGRCGAAALDRIFELKLTDPQFGCSYDQCIPNDVNAEPPPIRPPK